MTSSYSEAPIFMGVTSTASALFKTDPLCCAQHNGSYVEYRIMLSCRWQPPAMRGFPSRRAT
jgi:hypothetical protein